MPAPTVIESLAGRIATNYHLLRGITTIPDPWLEWTVGLKGQVGGGPGSAGPRAGAMASFNFPFLGARRSSMRLIRGLWQGNGRTRT
jgi:hypothetical protein